MSDANKVQLPIVCIGCGRSYIVRVYSHHLAAWRSGTLIQDAFPYLPADERELLMTKLCDACFKAATREDD